jgi:hypothetical protein
LGISPQSVCDVTIRVLPRRELRLVMPALLSMAGLNIARSRLRPSSWSRTRMVQTSSGFNGRFWPIRRPLLHGSRQRADLPPFREAPRPPADALGQEFDDALFLPYCLGGRPISCFRSSSRTYSPRAICACPSVGNARASHCFLRRGEGPADRNGLVRVLLDECIDWRLGRELGGNDGRQRD